MNKLFIEFVVILIVMLGASFSALGNTIEHIIETKELELCAHPQQMPISKKHEDAVLASGLQIDLARALADKLNVRLNISWVINKRHVKDTECDFYAGVAKLAGRESKYVQISDAYYRMTFVIVTLKQFPPIENPKQLNNLIVGVSPGSVAARALHEYKIETAVRFSDEESRLQALIDGKIDAAVVTSLAANWFAKENKIELGVNDVEMVFDISTNYDYALGLRKANNETLIVFNNQLQGMKKDGTLSQLFEKYGIGPM